MTFPVSNPYESEPVSHTVAFAFATGVWVAELRVGFRHPVVEMGRFADAAVAAGVCLDDLWGFYERMARGETGAADLPSAA